MGVVGVEGLPASFEGAEVGGEVMETEGSVVLGGDALVGECLGDAVEVRSVGGGAVLGPCGVEVELEEIAGEGFRFDGVLIAVKDAVFSQVGGEFGRVRVVAVSVVEVGPDLVVAVDGGGLWPRRGRGRGRGARALGGLSFR
ncbi:hypothetical protein ACWD3J_49730 [Streptomyces sp. NPDC002755]|uniref:hypothetical protein n=1 Tax=Streptomyces sp. NPDC002884 TaxID=3154544 RepID=UPI0033192F5E